MASDTPRGTRTSSATTTPTRGRGRGRPRIHSRGTSSALNRRRNMSTPRGTEATPSARRKVAISAGYRPGGAGGGGRYIHPITGEEIPSAIWKELLRKGELDDILNYTMASATPRRAVHAPPPPPLPVGPDGVYKPREERSYQEFHPSFDPDQVLPVFPAEEIDGDNYKTPSLEQTKSVTIADVKEERQEAVNTLLSHNTNVDDKSQISTYPASPSLAVNSTLGAAEQAGSVGAQPQMALGNGNLDTPMEGVQSTDNLGIAIDPALTGLTPPPPPQPAIDPALLPVDPALQAQETHIKTPAATPTDTQMDDHIEDTIYVKPPPREPMTPGPANGEKRGKEVPTLASTRPQRTTAGQTPARTAPPTTGRRSRPTQQPAWGEEHLQLRAPSYRPIQPFRYSDVAWNSQIGRTGAFGLNTTTSTGESYSHSMIKAGYQQTAQFKRPDTLFRDYPDTSVDDELGCGEYDVVEYDMDEQDDKWLTHYNSHRYLKQATPITREVFEIAMTKVEKEWVALERRIPKVTAKPHGGNARRRSQGRTGDDEDDGSEDSKCAICDDGECENANAIVFCDGCNLAVHQECYGVPYIPEGQWHCRKCQQIPRQTAHCVFCPNTDGAFKQTTTNRWAHLLCAIWIPEVRLANPAFMEPVEGIELVPKSRWKLTCYICKQKMGACIQCSNKNCFVAFHVTCGRRARLHMKMKNSSGPGAQLESSNLKALCDRHVPADWRRENDVDNAVQDAMDFYATELYGREWGDSQAAAITGPGILNQDEYGNSILPRVNLKVGDKRKRQQQEQKAVWKLPSGAPVIPHVLYKKIAGYMAKFDINGVEEFTADVCKYWTLKREARRGACLIRRLQIQADSSSFTSLEITRKNYASLGRTQGEKELGHRRDFATSLERDLANMMAAMLDNQKSGFKDHELYGQDADRLRCYIDAMYFPETLLIRNVINKAKQLDTNGTYEYGFSLITDRNENRLYPSVHAFHLDLKSVLQSPPAEPRLDFVIKLTDYHPPQRPRSTTENPAAATTNGNSVLVRLEPILQQALETEKELRVRLREIPAKKFHKVERSEDQANGVTPMELDVPNGGPLHPDSPSAQLAQEAVPQNGVPEEAAVKKEALPETGLAALIPDITSSLEKGRWSKGCPLWYVNDYRQVEKAEEGEVTDAYYERVVGTCTALADALPLPADAPPEPVPAPEPAQPAVREEPAPAPAQSNGVDHDSDEDMEDASGDADEEDAPGEVDEDYLPALASHSPAEVTNTDADQTYSDLHDEDAEGEDDDDFSMETTPASGHISAQGGFTPAPASRQPTEPKETEKASNGNTTTGQSQGSPTAKADPVTSHAASTPATAPAKPTTSVNTGPPQKSSPENRGPPTPRQKATSPKKTASPRKSATSRKSTSPTKAKKSASPPKATPAETKLPETPSILPPPRTVQVEKSPRRRPTTPHSRHNSTTAAVLPTQQPKASEAQPPAAPPISDDIRKDDDLFAGYRPEDLPSPVVPGSPAPATPPRSNGAAAAAPTSHPDPALPPPHDHSLENADLELMTSTSALSDYPDSDEDALLPENGDKPKERSPESVKRRRADFVRDSNGRFGKAKGGSGETPRSSRRRGLRG